MKDYILDLDRPRELRFGFKAVRDIRKRLGERSIESLINLKWDEVPILVWAGLKHEDKQLTVEKVEDLLDDSIPKNHTIMAVTNIAFEAFADHMGLELKKVKADDQETEKVAEKKKPTKTIPSTKKQKK